MHRPPVKPGNYECQVCGHEAPPEIVSAMAAHEYLFWTVHRIEQKGGIVQVLSCPECALLTEDLILESYKERIRLGLIPGFH